MKSTENKILVLQGGGALGAYQAGAYAKLSSYDVEPSWVAGISIGAINAAIICGNPIERRVERLHAFWNRITSELTFAPWLATTQARQFYGEVAAATVMATGVPGFFRPKSLTSFTPFGQNQTLSYYDTSPLRDTLLELVDFDYLNTKGPRLSIGAVDIETANFAYFDSTQTTITPEHIMASGALPPGFSPIEVDGKFYWDGGLVSNTPLQYVMANLGTDATCIFQVDVFSAKGTMPTNLAEVAQRGKDIQFSSRTRLTTDRYRQLDKLRAAAARLKAKLPKEFQDDPDLALLQTAGPQCPITLVHLIHKKEPFETQSKDYEFSRLTMSTRWKAGEADTAHTFENPQWQNRKIGGDSLQVFDLCTASHDTTKVG